MQEPIVVASALEFSPMWWYADRQMRPQLHYLADLDYARRLHSDLIPEYSQALERSYPPMPAKIESAKIEPVGDEGQMYRELYMVTSESGQR